MIKLKLADVECFERDVKLRLPFRFGVITVTQATQAVIRATIELEGGRRSVGVAAESLAAKWFDKNPAFSDAQNLEQLRQSLALAIAAYRGKGWSTPFALYSGCYGAQIAMGGELGLVPLVASYGPALLDRAILDAVGRELGLSFAAMIRRNVPGIAATDLTPDLAGFDLVGFLGGLQPGRDIAVRHTVGLVDPIVASDQAAGERVDDGLPETLEEVARRYRGRYYKLKVAGDVAADLERLTRIARVLDREIGDYRVTLDGNEQYDDIEGIAELWQRMHETPSLARLVASTLFIEQPIKRAAALARPVQALARLKPLIIDEFDGELSSFPAAQRLSAIPASPARTARGSTNRSSTPRVSPNLNAEAGQARRYFMSRRRPHHAGRRSACSKTWPWYRCWGSDTSSATAITSSMACRSRRRREQEDFARAHPDLYEQVTTGVARLRHPMRGGSTLASLDCPGFAVAARRWISAAMRPMRAAPRQRVSPPAHPERA